MSLSKACYWFFKILKHGESALEPQPAPEARPTFSASPEQAIQLMGLFQKEGRLLDFLQEDIAPYSNEEVGAAIRDIHSGCNKVLAEHFAIRRVVTETEGSQFEVNEGFDPSAIEILGAPESKAPYKGELVHAGWYVDEVNLPSLAEGADPNVIAPAQVEVHS